MVSRRFRTSLLILSASLLLLPVGSPAALAGETKTIAEKNVRWTLPEGAWAFQEIPEAEKQSGFVLRAMNNDIATTINVLVRPAEGLAPQAFLEEVIGFARGQLQEVKAAKTFEGRLSGKDATCAFVHGKTKGDAELHASMYVLAYEGQLYLVLVQAYHGAHKKAWKTIDEARRGVRLIQGGGAEESPATGPVPDGDGEGGGEDIGGGTGMDGEEELDPAKWPEKGPKWDAGALVFPTHNLRWTLPPDTPFKVTGVVDDESAYQVPLVILRAKQGEGETANSCVASVAAIERKPGYLPRAQVKDMGYQEAVASSFHERLPGGVTLEEELDVGGARGAAFGLKGKDKEGVYVSVMDYWVALRGEIYRFRFVSRGDRDADRAFEGPRQALMQGVGYIEPGEGVAGPLATGIPFHVLPRGSYAGKEYEMTAPGIELEKPEVFSKMTNPGNPNVHFVLEARTEDGGAYFYVDVQSFETAALNQNRRKPEDFIEERALAWEEQASGGVKLRKGSGDRGPMHFKAKWGRAKGLGYRFEATFLGHPFVENGYIVSHRQRTYFIKEQYGGEGAEKKFKKTLRALQKGWTWAKK